MWLRSLAAWVAWRGLVLGVGLWRFALCFRVFAAELGLVRRTRVMGDQVPAVRALFTGG